MKKSILVSLMLLVSMLSFAQEELGTPKYYTVPAVFTPTDKVTIVDVVEVEIRCHVVGAFVGRGCQTPG